MEHDPSMVEQVQEVVAYLPKQLQAMLATEAPPLAASKGRSTATSIHERQIDNEATIQRKSDLIYTSHAKNCYTSSERSSSVAGLNTARTSTPSLKYRDGGDSKP
jgi:hypothetical protein